MNYKNTLAVFILVTTTAISGCHNTTETPEASKTTAFSSEPTPGPALWLDSFDTIMQEGSDPASDTGCPAFREREAKSYFARYVRFDHTAFADSSARFSSLRCWGRLFGGTSSSSTSDDGLWIEVRKDPDLNAKTAAKPLTWFDRALPKERTALAGLTEQHPGFGASSKDLDFVWMCGKYLISASAYNRHALFKPGLDPSDTMREFFVARVKQLCGTVDSPSIDVSQAPYTSWKIYETFGGQSPASYSVPRPKDLPASERRDLTTP